MYHNCCNENGNIVRNKEMFHKYKISEHLGGKRGKRKNQDADWEVVVEKKK